MIRFDLTPEDYRRQVDRAVETYAIEDRAQRAEREGNAYMANGLALRAKAAYRRADDIRRETT